MQRKWVEIIRRVQRISTKKENRLATDQGRTRRHERKETEKYSWKRCHRGKSTSSVEQ